MDPLSITASIIAVLPATKGVISYLKETKDAPKELTIRIATSFEDIASPIGLGENQSLSSLQLLYCLIVAALEISS
jgi:hypothetical protein